ncbi:MAG: three-Cys-motif partner protein TcmP [Proteobacteria bacterium]|nr:three-Cys-motif partner protein TcmP [Pseudomonadota bacterium]
MFVLPPPEDDKLLIPTVGEWSHDKHYYLQRYIDAFTTSMHGKKKWSGLHYIDLFAGAGIERRKESGTLEWGSALIAAQAPRHFEALHLCEKNERTYEALVERVERVSRGRNDQVLLGDANIQVLEIIKQIPETALSLAFLDPYGLHLDFATLRLLAAKTVDLLVFFPDFLDVVRNLKAYRDKPNSNLDRVLGTSSWRQRIDRIPQSRRVEEFREIYRSQIKALGYKYFEFERICAKGHPLYLLIFCSRHPLAAKLWRGIAKKKANDQHTFDFT